MLAVLLLLLFLASTVQSGSMLTVAGKLECCTSDKTPCPIYEDPVLVEVWEKNKIRDDKLLTKVQTDQKTGNFIFTIPNKKGLFAFEPYIKIVHSCSAKPGCKRSFKLDIPQVYIRKDWTFSITHLNLRKPFLGANIDKC